LSFGAATELEVQMAELITELVPSVEMVRMVNSGTEAVMSAIRVARVIQKGKNYKVCRLLSRTCGQHAGQSRLGCDDKRNPQ